MSIMIIIISGCIASTRVIFMFMTSCIRHPRMTCMYKTYTCTCIRHPSTDWSDITIIASGHSVVVCRVPYLRYFHVQLSPTSEIFSFWDISHIWDFFVLRYLPHLRYVPYLRYFRLKISPISEIFLCWDVSHISDIYVLRYVPYPIEICPIFEIFLCWDMSHVWVGWWS